MPQFLTRQSFFQQQPQAAQLPFSQFGGNRPPLQGDTTGGIAFPDAGQAGQPTQSPLSPFLLPTGLSDTELNALLGVSGLPGTKQQLLGFDPIALQDFSRGGFNTGLFGNQQPAQTSSLPPGGIPIEGSGGFDKFNPVIAGGTQPNKLGGF
jgi:hypothetical protein